MLEAVLCLAFDEQVEPGRIRDLEYVQDRLRTHQIVRRKPFPNHWTIAARVAEASAARAVDGNCGDRAG
jgi:hypothetical protein